MFSESLSSNVSSPLDVFNLSGVIVETGYRYVNQYGSNLSLVNSNTVNGRRYYAQAHREYPTESGYVSGTWQP